MAIVTPEKQRLFASEAVHLLRKEGFDAYWAGGCVRDQLLGREPKDYDVATNATPPQIRKIFGRRRTLAIGAAFGVITVLGPPGAGQIEVATFRRDATYSDGRHPDSVAFTDAREDALRRDFTINGLFFDPVAEQVLDFVGGQEDLRRQVIRAIGDPYERFREDKLRLLRAVRFAATFGFDLDPATLDAVRQMAPQITVVSPERISAEMHRLLVSANRVWGVRLLLDTGLGTAILPEVQVETGQQQRLEQTLAVLERLAQPRFPLALAALLYPWVDADAAEGVCRRWRMSNDETERVCWLVEHHAALDRARSQPWSVLQPILVSEGSGDLLALAEARSASGMVDCEEVEHVRPLLERPREELDPPPLVRGGDLLRLGLTPGPLFKTLLERVRAAQLDGAIHTQAEALALVDRLMESESLMDKKVKKKVDTLNQRLQKLRQQLAGAKKQADDPSELRALERQIAEAEAELAKVKQE